MISLLVSYYLSCQDSLLFATNIGVSLFVPFCLSCHASNCHSSELFHLVLTVYIPLLASKIVFYVTRKVKSLAKKLRIIDPVRIIWFLYPKCVVTLAICSYLQPLHCKQAQNRYFIIFGSHTDKVTNHSKGIFLFPILSTC